ncbi:glycosyl hydrolase family 2 [Jejuia pallidilutea]|uniref:Glycosyl hydrolase family 2 n=1 Tax=Jejuia pallidilutea TaxID=504487 RepID=A0A362X273_9FLAO|nr:sugar-binding domain-containing protein [Jejuia pallidilutea]PQV48226.1 glycosyl hydrolase family 2 [Jejuia pallidilutea]
MKQLSVLWLTLFTLVFLNSCEKATETKLDLSGEWTVKLDSAEVGFNQKWASKKIEGNKIALPATLDEAGIGKPNQLKPAINNYVMSNLTRKHQYIGKAWYQKEVNIPKDWASKTITLNLERIIWESSVFIDGKLVGTSNSLVGNHVFDLTSYISTGKHLLTICVDNSNKFPNINVAGTKYPDKVNQDMAHAYTNHTQIKWNGILGDIALYAHEDNAPKNLQIYPNSGGESLRISFEQKTPNVTALQCKITSISGDLLYSETISNSEIQGNKISFSIQKPKNLEYWDEFNPALYDVEIQTNSGEIVSRFGFKTINNTNANLSLNGKRIFLRGNLECVIFPLTGRPPMKKEAWAKLIAQAKNYGLNHLRFHSWCPPKAAFEAADEAGFYYQVELPHWSLKVGEDTATNEFLRSEAHKIINDYGNHPSFVLMAMGNELQGSAEVLNNMVAELKTKDNRHLYATTAFSFQQPMGTRPEPEDDFFVAQWTDKGWIRGQGVFNSKPPHFNADFTSGSAHIKIPLISHEIGQYSVYPDMSEIEKYTGVLKPLNFIAVKEDLERKGLLDLAPEFTYNSGKLAALLYKEEIERALKTPSFDGFQLLQLQDFPGQGTALVGLLNAFWESKGVISAEEFRQFNSELVPLIRFEKAVYETEETFEAAIEIANFFEPKTNQVLDWEIADESGHILKNGSIKNVNLKIGHNTNLGTINFPIVTNEAKKLTIKVALQDSPYKNSWHIWVYPKNVSITAKDIEITNSFDSALKMLNEGKKVLLSPDPKTLSGIEGRFVPVFWSPVHFPNQPATMGVLLDDNHPAFNSFPTSTHSDWQWWDLCINSKSIITDSLEVTPIVRVIDNFVTNHHLANVFEAKCGKGNLVFSSIDITSDLDKRPVARQLRHSLLQYMEGTNFTPSKTLKIKSLNDLELNKKQNGFSTKDIYN